MKRCVLLLALTGVFAWPVAAQEIQANARKVSWGKGWICNTGYVERGSACIVLGLATDDEIRRYMIGESLASYPGNCPCPYNTDRAGRRCGGRSAYSRPGGRSPLCYPTDITDEQVKRMREQYRPPRDPV